MNQGQHGPLTGFVEIGVISEKKWFDLLKTYTFSIALAADRTGDFISNIARTSFEVK
ncbi:hypothetical protein KKB18_06640 [bacterium]|nr:hypothetical protein [bacterium]